MSRFEKSRPSPWLIKAGFLHGTGLGAPEIAHQLNMGVMDPDNAVKAESLRRIFHRADLPHYGFRTVPVRINFRSWERDFLQERADEMNMPMERMLYRFAKAGLVYAPNHRGFCMYDSVVDGMFDKDDALGREGV